VRDLTAERGVLLIFDEVVTGFRYAPGGAQEYYGVTPDLTTLAKILAGGLPGGAVAGRADILERFLQRDGIRKVSARDLPVAVAQRADGATTVAAWSARWPPSASSSDPTFRSSSAP